LARDHKELHRARELLLCDRVRSQQSRFSSETGWEDLPSAPIPPDLVLVFGGRAVLEEGRALTELGASVPRDRIFGCSTAGEIEGSRLRDESVVATSVWFDRSHTAAASVSLAEAKSTEEAGRVLASSETLIGPRDTSTDLEPRLAELGAPLVIDAIERLAAATDPRAIGAPQDPSAVTRAPRLSKADSAVDWSRPAVEIDRRRRAMEPWPRTTTYLLRDGHAPLRLVLEDLLLDAALPDRTGSPATPPGTVLAADETGIRVACGGGTALTITRLIPEGRKAMTAAEFLRGARLVPGQRFGPMPELTPGR
jgi:hypothetical protein